MKTISKTTKTLPVKLTDEEVQAASLELAQTVEELESAEEDEKGRRGQAKALLDELDGRKRRLAYKINHREEPRSVDVELRADYDEVEVIEVRTDTGEILKRRPMDAEEKQRHLEIGGEA